MSGCIWVYVCVCWCLCFGVKLSPPYTSHNINHRHLAKVNVTTAYANISLQSQKGVQMWASGWWRRKYMRMCLLIVKKYPFSSCKHWSLLDWFAWCCNHCNQLIDFGRRLKDLIDGVWIQRLRSIFTTDGQRTKQITRQDYLNLNGKGAKSVKKTCHRHPIITFRNGHKLLTSGLSCCVFILSIDH